MTRNKLRKIRAILLLKFDSGRRWLASYDDGEWLILLQPSDKRRSLRGNNGGAVRQSLTAR
jgi:hypothetical protein